MKHTRAQKSLARRAKIEALPAQVDHHETDVACHVLTCSTPSSYCDAVTVKVAYPPHPAPPTSISTTNRKEIKQ
jgi:hypothetical protein